MKTRQGQATASKTQQSGSMKMLKSGHTHLFLDIPDFHGVVVLGFVNILLDSASAKWKVKWNTSSVDRQKRCDQ